MSKAKNKKQKKSEETPAARKDDTAKDAPFDAAEQKTRSGKNENMFRMWNARPTRVPSVPKAAGSDAAVLSSSAKPKLDWKSISIAATIVCVLAVFSHITGLFGNFVLNDQLILTPLKIGADNDRFWTLLMTRGLATPLSGLWTNVSLALDLKSGSLVWFHLVNLFLHTLTSLYLFILLFQVGKYWKIEQRVDVRPEHFAFAAAGLFACHPLASEVVSYIPGREMALVGANYMLAMLFFFIAFVSSRLSQMIFMYAAMFVCIVMASFSGPASVTLPIALLSLAALAKPPEMKWSEFAQLRWSDLTVIGMLALGFGYLIYMGIPTALNNGIGLNTLPFDQYLASQFKAFVVYFARCFFVPGGLSIEPPLVVATGFTDPLALLGIAAVGGVGYLAYRFRNIPPVVFGLTLTLIGLLPDFVLPQAEIVSDARFYISLAGLSTVFGWVVAKMALLNFKQVIAAVAILFVGLAGLSNWRALAWHSEQELWREVLRTNPGSARAHAKLASQALLEKKVPEARKEVEEALKLDPNLSIAHLTLGRIHQNELNEAEAFKEFELALKLAKEHKASPVVVAQSQAQVADALVRQGDYARVKELVEEARLVLGESAQLHYLAGMQLLHEKNFLPAIYELQQGIIQDPRSQQYLEPLAEAYLGSRMPTLIPQAYQILERVSLPTRESLLLKARAALEMNRIEEAKTLLEQGAKLGSEDAEVFYLRYFIARAQKNDAQAQAFKAKALSLDAKIETNVPVVSPEDLKKYTERETRKQQDAAKQSIAPKQPDAAKPPESTEPAKVQPGN